MWQFHPQHGGLNIVHAAVRTQFVVVIAFRAAVITKPTKVVGNLLITCCNQPRVAVCTQILAWIETERRGSPERTCSAIFPASADCLSSILDENHFKVACDLLK